MRVPVENYGHITRATREVAGTVYGESKHGWQITFARPDGETWLLSQLDDEPRDRWVVDGRILENGYPVHLNGFGARYLRVARLNDDAAAALNRVLAEIEYLEHLDQEHDADLGHSWV